MLTNTKNNTRVQFLLNKTQKEFLDNVSSSKGISASALIRDIVDQYRLKQRDMRLEAAATELYSEYKINNELISFTSLDGEDFYEARGSLGDKP
ncbi:MAG: hypothetical protein J7K85_07660 [Anaerolineaceae bacterium]|nr:hypothetical protein [Anaerolineaceae bacterium]